MKTSSTKAVAAMYDATADQYAQMMDVEIDLPVYTDTLGRLSKRIRATSGCLVDAACGSGQMLALYHQLDGDRALMGVDLSPKMVQLAAKKLGSHGEVVQGDMSKLTMLADGTVAAIVNFFALHHLDPAHVRAAVEEWHRVLTPGGQLVVAVWEGSGPIDYGGHADLVALRYRAAELSSWIKQAGFTVSRCVVEDVADFPMDAVYLEATKN